MTLQRVETCSLHTINDVFDVYCFYLLMFYICTAACLFVHAVLLIRCRAAQRNLACSSTQPPSSSHEHKPHTHPLINSGNFKRNRGHKTDWTNYVFPSPRHQDKLRLLQVQNFPSHDSISRAALHLPIYQTRDFNTRPS